MNDIKRIRANIAVNRNYQKLKNNRKRKQHNNNNNNNNKTKKRDRNSKIHPFSGDARGVIKIRYDTISPSILQQLPMMILSQIVSNLNIIDQKHFSDTCRAARTAMKVYWDTYNDLHIDTLMEKTFSFVAEKNRCSLHAIRREITLTLCLIPNFTLRKLYFQPVYSLHLQDLRDIEIRAKKTSKEIFGSLKHLDLRGCVVEYGELKYFSNACAKLTSIAITHAAVFLPNEMFINDDHMKQHKLKDPFETIRNFFGVSLPNFTEMEKRGTIPAEHTELLLKLFILFPYIETFHID
ncbi:unnamed protein product [Cercopithifilaria johnstoni]|uniref:F-box domain-containing protein n=1 Tax=Cercopithifilaria johnstoni TaxID=2874296 RepID=A0A8J2MFI7_9BILA|nr:unnamed protein product [Cercopithifilaria johnstoni]